MFGRKKQNQLEDLIVNLVITLSSALEEIADTFERVEKEIETLKKQLAEIER